MNVINQEVRWYTRHRVCESSSYRQVNSSRMWHILPCLEC